MATMSKDEFHKFYLRRLREIAVKELKLTKDQFRVRSNKAGDGILGEVILHTEILYVRVGGLDQNFCMYRSCRGMKDYLGGTNRYMDVSFLGSKACVSLFYDAMAAAGTEPAYPPSRAVQR